MKSTKGYYVKDIPAEISNDFQIHCNALGITKRQGIIKLMQIIVDKENKAMEAWEEKLSNNFPMVFAA